MNEIVSLLKEIMEIMTEIRDEINEILEETEQGNDLVHVGDTVYDADGRAMIVTHVGTDTFQAEYID